MNWLLRPSILVLVSVALALSAAALVVWPRAPENKALAQPVPEGDQEVAWLYAATNAAPWERFVKAVETARSRLQAEHQQLGLEIDDRRAFPLQTTTVPELAVSVQGSKGRLWFRWYKLTSDLKSQDWVKALLQRRPAPLAIIGGSSSDLAIELAQSLKSEDALQTPDVAAPLLLLTTATAEAADDKPGIIEKSLNSIYAGRTYRFCFTNRHMAEAVIDFIWSHDDLRPDCDPLYLTHWNDDPYSTDLNRRFLEALRLPATRAVARDWAALAGYAVAGGFPLHGASACWDRFRLGTPESTWIPYSVGSIDRPNRWEVDGARNLIEAKLHKYPEQQRPLLIIPAASQPARRFLRALVHFAPSEAKRFVVATGDAIAFNTVYRDRNVAWPIQDLPFSLVFFCHRNPADSSAGFQEENRRSQAEPGNEPRPAETYDGGSAMAGTEDLLLFVDIVEVLVQAGFQDGRLVANPDLLMQRLSHARWQKEHSRVSLDQDSQPFFDDEGNRRSGTGEHVVFLRPFVRGEMILPRAAIEVWPWLPKHSAGRQLAKPQCLLVDYEGPAVQDIE